MQAYNIVIQANDTQPTDGWCFGYGPGITPEQWPRDEIGLPMRHAFTLRLPEAYRRRGPELVAIAMFWSDHGEPPEGKPSLDGLPAYEAHPQDARMRDILDSEYAVLWLTEAEVAGARCPAPLPSDLTHCPVWMEIGGGAAFAGLNYVPRESLSIETHFQMRQLGGVPEIGLDWACALTLTPREGDPNAGEQPPEGDFFEEETPEGYKLSVWFGGDNEMHQPEWGKALSACHLGGTMQIQQAHPYPAFSPYYIGLDEVLGGFNFGTGTGQLDLESMRLDWACG